MFAKLIRSGENDKSGGGGPRVLAICCFRYTGQQPAWYEILWPDPPIRRRSGALATGRLWAEQPSVHNGQKRPIKLRKITKSLIFKK